MPLLMEKMIHSVDICTLVMVWVAYMCIAKKPFKPVLKAGVNLKAVFMPIKIGFMEISRSRFKQSKISLLKTETNVIGCFVNF